MRITFILIFFLAQICGFSMKPPPNQEEGEIIITQKELESFLRLLVEKRIELERLSRVYYVEKPSGKNFEEKSELIEVKRFEAIREIQEETKPLVEKSNLAKEKKETESEVATDHTNVSYQDLRKIEESLKMLEASIQSFQAEKIQSEKETKVLVEASSQQDRGGILLEEKTVARLDSSNNRVIASLESQLKSQEREIMRLTSMVETLALRREAFSGNESRPNSQAQPVYVLSTTQAAAMQPTRATQPMEVDKQRTELETKTERQEIEKESIALDQEMRLVLDNFRKEEIIAIEKDLAIADKRLLLNIKYLTVEINSLKNEIENLFKLFSDSKTERITEEKSAELPLDPEKIVVFFGNDSYNITGRHLEALKEMAQNVIKSNHNYQVSLNGYSSNTGSAEYNMQLSRRRAQEVKTLLASQGLLPSQISVSYHGIDNETNEQNARRVEVVIQEHNKKN